MKINKIDLTREIKFLHHQFFRYEASHQLIEDYLKAHKELFILADASDSEQRTVRIIIEKKLDALGIEPWLRTGVRRHLLSRKLLLVSYLVECDGAHPEYRQEVEGRVRCFVRLCWVSVLATIRLLRGRLQKIFYELV